MNSIRENFDIGTLIVIAITFILFAIALFHKGFTHDLLLEAAVFLVSVKLILLSYQNSVTGKRVLRALDDIKKTLAKPE